jgi:hypothetical protein
VVGEGQHCCSRDGFGCQHWCILLCFASICRFPGKFHLHLLFPKESHASLYGRNRNREVNLLMVCCFQSFDHADLRGRDMSGQDLKGVVFAGT